MPVKKGLSTAVMNGGAAVAEQFVHVCYNNGMANFIRFKDRIQVEVMKVFNVKVEPRTIQQLYATLVKSHFKMPVGKYHDALFVLNLMKYIKQKHYDVIGEIRYQALYNEFQNECWMLKYRSAKTMKRWSNSIPKNIFFLIRARASIILQA